MFQLIQRYDKRFVDARYIEMIKETAKKQIINELLTLDPNIWHCFLLTAEERQVGMLEYEYCLLLDIKAVEIRHYQLPVMMKTIRTNRQVYEDIWKDVKKRIYKLADRLRKELYDPS